MNKYVYTKVTTVAAVLCTYSFQFCWHTQ